MKKLLFVLLAAICPFVYMGAETHKSAVSDSYEIDLEKTPALEGKGEFGFPRSIYFLEAYYDPSFGEITIKHSDLGNIQVYIYDEQGHLVAQSDYYSSGLTSDVISIPAIKGSYSILIYSSVVYAYGVMTLQ